MLVPIILTMLVGQISQTGNVLTVLTPSIISDGASFRAIGVATLPASGGTYEAGLVSGTTSTEEFAVSSAMQSKLGTDSYSQPITFYFCGSYSGSASSLPTSISYSIAKTEQSQAAASGLAGSASASASTANTSMQASSPSSGAPVTFSNTVSGTLGVSTWQLQPDGTYSFNSYVFSNTPSTSATVTIGSKFSGASAFAKIVWSLSSATASN